MLVPIHLRACPIQISAGATIKYLTEVTECPQFNAMSVYISNRHVAVAAVRGLSLLAEAEGISWYLVVLVKRLQKFK